MESIGLPPPEIHHFFIFRKPQLVLGHIFNLNLYLNLYLNLNYYIDAEF